MFFSKSTSILWAPSAKYFHPLLITVYYTNMDGQWTLSSRSLSCKVDKISMLLQYEVESDVLKETQCLDVLRGSNYQEEWRKWPVIESLLFGNKESSQMLSPLMIRTTLEGKLSLSPCTNTEIKLNWLIMTQEELTFEPSSACFQTSCSLSITYITCCKNESEKAWWREWHARSDH